MEVDLVDLVKNCVKGIENDFECDGITEAQKMSIEKSRLRGFALTWWKSI